jgi:hypothetical protein
VEGSALYETKEETLYRVEVGDVGALTTLGTFAPTARKSRMIRDTPRPIGNLSGNRLGRAALRREQREPLEINHPENRATEEKGKTEHRRHKHSPQKRREQCSV